MNGLRFPKGQTNKMTYKKLIQLIQDHPEWMDKEAKVYNPDNDDLWTIHGIEEYDCLPDEPPVVYINAERS